MFKAKDMMTFPQRQITMPMKVAQPEVSGGGESGAGSEYLVQGIVIPSRREGEKRLIFGGAHLEMRRRPREKGGGVEIGKFSGIGDLFVVD
jgi:hypothetical protein